MRLLEKWKPVLIRDTIQDPRRWCYYGRQLIMAKYVPVNGEPNDSDRAQAWRDIISCLVCHRQDPGGHLDDLRLARPDEVGADMHM